MRVGIISDTHGDGQAFQMAKENCFSDIDLLIHAGDVLYHGPRNPLTPGHDPAGLARDLNLIQVEVVIARGNCDAQVDQMVLQHPLVDPGLDLTLGHRRVMVYHGHQEPWVDPLARDLVISGHTHIYELSQREGTIFVNPGSPSLPKGGQAPTVALWEDDVVRILDIKTGATLSSIRW